MKKMLTGCAIPILLFALFFGGYAYLFLTRVEPAWLAYIFSGVGALMLCLVVGAIKTLFQTGTIAAALRRARQKRQPEDGKFAVIQGDIAAVGDPIHAPFSQMPCVSYEYEMSRTTRSYDRKEGRSRTSKESFIFGLAKTGYIIRTSEGDVRLLGFPMLDHLSTTSWSLSEESQIRQCAEDFLQNEHFQKAGGLNLAGAFSQMVGVIVDDTEAVRKDWKVSNPDKLNGVALYETRLEPGQQVCALGKWDAKRSALQSPVELIAGEYKNVQKILIANKRFSAVFGLIFAIVFSAILIAFAWSFRPLSPEARPYRNAEFQSIVQSAPVHVILEMCRGDVDPNQQDSFGGPLIFRVRDADKLQALLDCGADPNVRDDDGDTKLDQTVRYGDAASVRVLLEAGVDIEAEIPEQGRGWTAMVSAYTANHPEIVDILAGAGAYDERVTAATGEPLTDDSAPMQAVRAYHTAIRAGDVETIKRLRPDKSPEWFEGLDFDETWKTYYPSEPALKQGFGNTRAATIELEKHTIEDHPVYRFFHLEYVTGGRGGSAMGHLAAVGPTSA